VKLTRESVILPMLGHKEMGGGCPSIGKIGVKAVIFLENIQIRRYA
jgi:hypothetical protein